VIEGYFGGEFARALEDEGGGAFAAFAIGQIVGALGSGMRARLAAPVDGRLFFAGEHCSAADFSTAHGAYRSGVKAAEDAIKALQVAPV